MPEATVVIPARNEGPLLEATLASLSAVAAGASFDVVVVDDGSFPPVRLPAGFGLDLRLLRTAGEGAAAARNRGAVRSSAEVLCFCDGHVSFTPGWLGRLLAALGDFDAASPAVADAARPQVAGYGFSWNARCETRWLPAPAGGATAEVPFLPGACLAVRRTAFVAVGGFDAGLRPWGYEDAELSWALWLSGFRCGVQPGASVRHRFRRRHPYPVLQAEVDRNLLRLGAVHFGEARLRRLSARLRVPAEVVATVRRAAADRRARLGALRRRDDDWFCARFGLEL